MIGNDIWYERINILIINGSRISVLIWERIYWTYFHIPPFLPGRNALKVYQFGNNSDGFSVFVEVKAEKVTFCGISVTK